MHLGWNEPIGTCGRLRDALRILAEAKGNYQQRMEMATRALLPDISYAVPDRLKNRRDRILNFRTSVREDYPGGTFFNFRRLKPSERKMILSDIMALYEACLIDIGKGGDDYNYLYPKDV